MCRGKAGEGPSLAHSFVHLVVQSEYQSMCIRCFSGSKRLDQIPLFCLEGAAWKRVSHRASSHEPGSWSFGPALWRNRSFIVTVTPMKHV